MTVSIRKIDRTIEQDIIISMLTDDNYLKILVSKIELHLIKNTYARTIIEWIMDYYKKYNECPFNEIKKIFEYKVKSGFMKDENEISFIERVLRNASEKFENNEVLNTNFMLKETEKYLNKNIYEKSFEGCINLFQSGRIEEAIEKIRMTLAISFSGGYAIDSLTDPDSVREAFQESTEPLFHIPHDFGLVLNEHLKRASMVAFQAAPKTGKTFMLSYLALQALASRLKVVFFQLGDLTKKQAERRLSITLSEKSDIKKYCGTFLKPTRFKEYDGLGTKLECIHSNFDLEKKEITIEKPLEWGEALENNKAFFAKNNLVKDRFWRMVTVSQGEMNAESIEAELQRLEKQEDFIADVIVIDYMELLGKESCTSKMSNGIDRIDDNWKGIKTITNRRECLAIVATQSNAASMNGDIQTTSNFADSSRKFRHVNAIFGMSANPSQKLNGILCVNPLMVRDGDANVGDVCYIAQSLRQGLAHVDSICPSLVVDGRKTFASEAFINKDLQTKFKNKSEKLPIIKPEEPNNIRGIIRR